MFADLGLGRLYRHHALLRPSVQFVGAVQMVTGVIVVAALLLSNVAWQWWLVALIGYFLYAGVGLSVGFHRYYAHRSFRAPRWAEIAFTLLGALGCSGSPASWVMMHRQHHHYADRNGDPHSPHHHGISVMFIHNYVPKNNIWQLRREFKRDRLQLWVHRYYVPLVLGFALLLLAIDWRLFVFGWALPVTVKLWVSGIAVYAGHRIGYRNTETRDDSRNVWWLGYFAWGEGWHNNHHARPGNWNFSQRWWEVDMGAWVVRAILLLGGKEPGRKTPVVAAQGSD